MDDLISRQAAIDAIRASTSKYTGFMGMEMYTDDDAVEAINGVPSAQPERKKGKWEVCGTFDDFLKCSCCGYKKPWNEDVFDFCPKCGADMREEKTDGEVC